MLSSNPNELFTYTVRAGSRSYYLNVKTDKNNEMYLVIKESKIGQDQSKEVHRVMIFERDFKKFVFGLRKVIQFINLTNSSKPVTSSTSTSPSSYQDENEELPDESNNVSTEKYEMDEFDLNPIAEVENESLIQPATATKTSTQKTMSLDEELFDTSDLQDNK